MGIKVLPPDVNDSNANFTPVGTDIRFGLAAVRNVGANVVESIVDDAAGQGRASPSFSDFLRKVPVNVCNKRVDRVAHQGRRVRLARAPPAAA